MAVDLSSSLEIRRGGGGGGEGQGVRRGEEGYVLAELGHAGSRERAGLVLTILA